MSNTVFQLKRPARELPISKASWDLLVAVDRELKNLTTDTRHTYGREYINLLLEIRRQIRKARAASKPERQAEIVGDLVDAYYDLADLLKLKTDTGDFPRPAYERILLPLGSLGRQALGWYSSIVEKIDG